MIEEYLKKHYCLDCKINKISYTNWLFGKKRCRSCSRKNYINYNEEKHKKHYCIEEGCNNEISYDNFEQGKQRCRSCSKKGKFHPFYKDGSSIIQHYCIENCGRQISYVNWLNGNKRCQSCAKTGDLNINWISDRNLIEYSDDFDNELKESIRKRDNYTCQNCNMTEEEHLIVIGEKLTIHHIDYNKKNSKENNLITVCHACNTRANYNRSYWIEYYQNKIKEQVNAHI